MKEAREGGFDIVILDVMLPGMDGFQICRSLRDSKTATKLPIVMLSAKARDSDRETGLKLGADEYLTKPVSPDQLVGVVAGLLANKANDS